VFSTNPLSALVVGGGVMGLATASALASRGAQVRVLERFSIAHDWASSHGFSRALRHEYGAAADYTAMVARSLTLWRALARETGRDLYTETGILTLGQPEDGYTLPGYTTMQAAGLPVSRLTHEECRTRFPQFQVEEYGAITYNAVGGILQATACVQALAQQFQARGGTLHEGVRVRRVEPEGDGGCVVLEDGTTLRADRVIVTAGAWVHDVLPDLQLPVRPIRGQVCYFDGLPADAFAVGAFPTFLAGAEAYGFPLHGPGWFKVGADSPGIDADPNVPYPPDQGEIDALRGFLHRVIPTAADANLVLVERCMHDVTPNDDFILDHHPGGRGVINGSGFSGHGFKFGPLIGEVLAARAYGEELESPLDQFTLSRFNG
jgi:monomeric sarcosine oxidase